MTGLRSISVWLSLIIFVVLPSRYEAAVNQVATMTDPAGFETSYPYDGGKLVMKCEGSATDKTFLKVTPPDKNVKQNPEASTEDAFDLKPGVIGTTYKCDKYAKAEIKIRALHCNPFSMIPEIYTCSDNEWCLIDNNGHAKCETRDYKHCFYQNTAKLNVVCQKGATMNYGNSGLCFAQSENVESMAADTCGAYSHLFSIGASDNTNYNDVELVPSSAKKWQFFSSESPLNCQVTGNESNSMANFDFSDSDEVAHKISFTKLPAKVQLNCWSKLGKADTQIMISRFLIIYDDDVSKYKVIIEKSIEKQYVSLSCTCDVPEGFLCGTTWSDSKQIYPAKIQPYGSRVDRLWRFKSSVTKYNRPDLSVANEAKIKDWEYPEPRNYTCYMQVFAFNYPNTFDLIKVPFDKEFQSQVTITPEDFLKNKPDLKNKDVAKEIKNGTGILAKEHAEIQARAKETDEVTAKINNKSTITVGLLAFCLVIVVICLVFTIILCACAVVISRRLRENKDQLDFIMSSLKIKRTGSRTGSMVEQSKKNSDYVDSNLSVAKQARKSVDKSKVRSSIGKSGPNAPKQQRKKSSIAK